MLQIGRYGHIIDENSFDAKPPVDLTVKRVCFNRNYPDISGSCFQSKRIVDLVSTYNISTYKDILGWPGGLCSMFLGCKTIEY